jgi:hypothetical protein
MQQSARAIKKAPAGVDRAGRFRRLNISKHLASKPKKQ